MDPNDWTLARGWAIALRKAGMRGGIIFLAMTVGLWLLWPSLEALLGRSGGFGGMNATFGLMIVVIITSILGAYLGALVVRKVKEDSALMGWQLLLPMLAIVLLAEAGACCVAAALRGVSPAMLIIPLCCMILWGVVAAFAKLIILS